MAARKLLIVGAGEFAEIACDYFTRDSAYDVAGFTVDSAFLTRNEISGLPVVAWDDAERLFPPADHDAFVAATYTQLNRVRTRFFHAARKKGYRMASYVSSKAFVWHNAVIGENCFVFEANVIQYRARVGDNVVLWSGNHIGHSAEIGDHCFLSSHVVVSGYCKVGESCFLGVNSTLGDFVKVGRDTIVGAGAVVLKDAGERQVLRGNPAMPAGADSFRIFRVKGEP